MPELMQHLCHASTFGCLLLALHFFKTRPVNRTPSLLLGTVFLVFAIQSTLLALLFMDPRPHLAAILRPALAMTIGPFVLLYFASAATPSFKFRLRHGLHLLPALFIAFELTAQTYLINIDHAILVSFGAYAIAVSSRAWRGPGQFAHLGPSAGDAHRWLVASAVLLGASFFGELAIYSDIVQGGSLSRSVPLLTVLAVNLVVVGVATTAALQRPSSLDWVYEFGALVPGKGTTLTDAECEACVHEFERLVEAEQLYAEENVTLRAIAKRLGVPARRLSESINRTYGESYSRRMNRLRVEEAKRLLRDNPHKTIVEAMFGAGFRTKSSFNQEFRAIEGMSPSEYRNGVVA